MPPADDVDAQLAAATALHQQGRLAEAESIYRRVLDAHPDQPWALHMLGLAAHQQQKHEAAERLLRRSLERSESEPHFHYNYALVCLSRGDVRSAETHFRRTIELQPNSAAARNHIGILLMQTGRVNDAIEQWRAALELRRDDYDIMNNLAGALAQIGLLDEAVSVAQRSASIAPDRPEAYNTLGNIHLMRMQHEPSLAAYAKAVQLAPNFANAWANMAVALQRAGRTDDAVAACRRALAIQPSHPQPHRTLGLIAYLQHQLDDAVALWSRAVELSGDPDAMSDLAGAKVARGELSAGLELYRHVLALRPAHAEARSAMLVSLHYDPSLSPDEIAREHSRFGEIHDARTAPPALTNSRDPDRVIRVGYVSPYFYRHAVATFVRGILRSHDRSRFAITCYSDTRVADDLTMVFRGNADQWRDTAHLSDAELADQIRADRQDILVDLNGHLAKNRLLMFAQRPAPVQATYIAYQNTTGLKSMDYRITDAIADPPGQTDHLHTEKLIRLPCFFVYRPPQSAETVAALPARLSGHITLGSLNNSSKFNPHIIELWSQILHRLPTARLMLLVNSIGLAERIIRDEFARHQIDPSRLRLIPRGPQAAYLRLYHQIDIGLDSWPFSGHTTTCDALWMGVPVVTLAGEIYASRMSASVLANLPLPQLITHSPQEYVEKAVSVASDLNELAELRASLRQRMTDSIICNAAAFTRSLEGAYREMWRTWCTPRIES